MGIYNSENQNILLFVPCRSSMIQKPMNHGFNVQTYQSFIASFILSPDFNIDDLECLSMKELSESHVHLI